MWSVRTVYLGATAFFGLAIVTFVDSYIIAETNPFGIVAKIQGCWILLFLGDARDDDVHFGRQTIL